MIFGVLSSILLFVIAKDKWMGSMTDEKKRDLIDYLDVLAKLLIPIAVAFVAFTWNQERTKASTSDAMIEIAIGVLREPKNPGAAVEPLREWAVQVLTSPDNPPPLSDAAIEALGSDSVISSLEVDKLRATIKQLEWETGFLQGLIKIEEAANIAKSELNTGRIKDLEAAVKDYDRILKDLANAIPDGSSPQLGEIRATLKEAIMFGPMSQLIVNQTAREFDK